MQSEDSGEHEDSHEKMMEDFRRRFFISLLVTVPILVLSPTLQDWLGFELAVANSK